MQHQSPLHLAAASQLDSMWSDVVAPGMSTEGRFVLLCDWQGRAVWGSMPFDRLKPGEFAWQHLAPGCREKAKEAIARAASLRESRTLELKSETGKRFRVWAWPLSRPDIAVCVLGVRIPANLDQLTGREQECLEWLGTGHSTQTIAEKLGIGVTTIHTHLRHCREKLGVESHEALIAFAAKHCQPPEEA